MVSDEYKIDRRQFLRHQYDLISIERNAEVERDLKKIGHKKQDDIIRELYITTPCSTKFGRCCMSFSTETGTQLPNHGLRRGDNVGIFVSSGVPHYTGVISEINPSCVSVTVDDKFKFSDRTEYTIRHLPSDETYKRMLQSVEEMMNPGEPGCHLVEVIFQETPLKEPIEFLPRGQCFYEKNVVNMFNNKLDESQRSAVDFVLRQKDLAVIHGPPGTGKTTTLIEIIRQHIRLGNKVLALAPSNLGVDNLVERLDDIGLQVVRLGHPARTTPETQRHTLDARLHSEEHSFIFDDITRMINKLTTEINNTDGCERSAINNKIRQLRGELRDRQEKVNRDIIKSADVVLCTLSSAHRNSILRHLPDDHFDLTVIDECSQVKVLQSLLRKSEVEVQTVDGFQGREKEAVILSLVRSNDKGEIGFLAEDRRLNVAVTRARRHLAVVCNTNTLGNSAFLKTFVDYMSQNGRVVRADTTDEGFTWSLCHSSLECYNPQSVTVKMWHHRQLYEHHVTPPPSTMEEKWAIFDKSLQYQSLFLYAIDSVAYKQQAELLIQMPYEWNTSDIIDTSATTEKLQQYCIKKNIGVSSTSIFVKSIKEIMKKISERCDEEMRRQFKEEMALENISYEQREAHFSDDDSSSLGDRSKRLHAYREEGHHGVVPESDHHKEHCRLCTSSDKYQQEDSTDTDSSSFSDNKENSYNSFKMFRSAVRMYRNSSISRRRLSFDSSDTHYNDLVTGDEQSIGCSCDELSNDSSSTIIVDSVSCSNSDSDSESTSDRQLTDIKFCDNLKYLPKQKAHKDLSYVSHLGEICNNKQLDRSSVTISRKHLSGNRATRYICHDRQSLRYEPYSTESSVRSDRSRKENRPF